MITTARRCFVSVQLTLNSTLQMTYLIDNQCMQKALFSYVVDMYGKEECKGDEQTYWQLLNQDSKRGKMKMQKL